MVYHGTEKANFAVLSADSAWSRFGNQDGYDADGLISNFTFHNRALLYSEIQELYEYPWIMTTRHKPVTTFVMNRPISKKVLLLKRNSVTTLIH